VHRHLDGGASLRKYVWQLEETIIDLCKRNFDLSAYRSCSTGYTGVWIDNAKIAAIGVHCKRYITYHGVAFNYDVDLDWFSHIVPCGISDRSVTSLTKLMAKESRPLTVNSLEKLKPVFLESVKKVFDPQSLRIAYDHEIDSLLSLDKVEQFS
jgi:lipoate-protein ligase B